MGYQGNMHKLFNVKARKTIDTNAMQAKFKD